MRGIFHAGRREAGEGVDANGPLDVTQARALLNDPDRVAAIDTQAFGKRLADILRRALSHPIPGGCADAIPGSRDVVHRDFIGHAARMGRHPVSQRRADAHIEMIAADGGCNASSSLRSRIMSSQRASRSLRLCAPLHAPDTRTCTWRCADRFNPMFMSLPEQQPFSAEHNYQPGDQ